MPRASRHRASGPGTAGVSTLVGDHHGTAGLSIANTTRQVSRRYTDPYGAPRGTAPSWAGDHGFLDKPTDTTGLVAIGARYYDPALGRFASVDPVMDLADPQQWHGYAYANNNPITWSDPTGLLMGPGGLKAPVPGAITRAMGKKSSSSAVPPTGPAKSVPVGNTRDAGLFSDVDPDLLQWPAPRGLEDVPFEGGLGWGFVATGLATLWCIVPGVGWASCGLAQAGALGVRTWETASGDGSAGDKAEAIALDVVLTGTGFGIAAAWVRLGRSMSMVDDAATTTARLEATAAATTAASGAGSGAGAAAGQVSPTPLVVHWGRQEKHFVGHWNFGGNSEVFVDPRYLVSRAGTGQPANSAAPGLPGYRERVDYGDVVIGVWVDGVTGVRRPTTVGILHYGSGGVHVVPGRPT